MPAQTERITKHMQSLDPTRLYNAASGWVDTPVGHFIDMHKYVGPGAFNPTSTRASVLGEFGGLGLKVDNHQWIPDDSFSYEMQVRLHVRHFLVPVTEMIDLLVWADAMGPSLEGFEGTQMGKGPQGLGGGCYVSKGRAQCGLNTLAAVSEFKHSTTASESWVSRVADGK